MKQITSCLLLGVIMLATGCNGKKNTVSDDTRFSFAFLTDIHLNYNNIDCFGGFRAALDTAAQMDVAFIITGGDNMDIDVLKNDSFTAIKLYKSYSKIIDSSSVKIISSVGNHDFYVGRSHANQQNGTDMFKKYVGKTYFSFDHKGWHFIILNTAHYSENGYTVDSLQKIWLQNDLSQLDEDTPIVVACHVPFISVYPFATKRISRIDNFSNVNEILEIFSNYNLKLVLQGHQHIYEEINVNNIQFITAGAVSASWWNGPYYGTEEGFLKVDVKNEEFSWEYVDYKWEAKQ